MGRYNSQYEDYYSLLRKKNNIRHPVKYNSNGFNNNSKNRNSQSNYFMKRIIRDLSGVLILFLVIISCKVMVNPKTQAVYSYSKQLINKTYDYKTIVAQIENIKFNDLQNWFQNFIENLKSKVSGMNNVDYKIKENFISPVNGIQTSTFGYRTDPITNERSFHDGIDIAVSENSGVKSVYYGKVKDCGNNSSGYGNYILIDHGSGIESKYAHLKKILVKKNGAVKKGQIIAESGDTGKSTGPHLHFEILCNGQKENPNKYFKIVKK